MKQEQSKHKRNVELCSWTKNFLIPQTIGTAQSFKSKESTGHNEGTNF